MNLPIFSFVFLIQLFANPVHAVDLGFRYLKGVCQDAQGLQGFNPFFLGQCGDLSGVTVGKFSFDGLDLSGSKFTSADLSTSSFRNTILTGAHLQNTNLSGVLFHGTQLDGTNLDQARLKNASIADCNFRGAKLTNIEAQGLALQYVDLSETDLKGANLEDADLSYALLDLSDLSGARLARAKLTSASLKNAILDSAQLEKAELALAVLNQTNFEKANLKGANFTDAVFSDVKLKGAIFNLKTKIYLSVDQAVKLGMIFIKLFEFTGIKAGLKISDLDGWKICHSNLYNSTTLIKTVLDACKSSMVMMACRKKGADILDLAAYGDYEKIFKEDVTNAGTVSNGTKFYFSSSMSMGFAPEGAVLNRSSCDFQGAEPEKRLCFHTNGGSMTDGYRCGSNDLNGSADYERMLFKLE